MPFANPEPVDEVLIVAKDNINLYNTLKPNKEPFPSDSIIPTVGYDFEEKVKTEHWNYVNNNNGVWLKYLVDYTKELSVEVEAIANSLINVGLGTGFGISSTGALLTGQEIFVNTNDIWMRDGDQTISGRKRFQQTVYTSEAQNEAGNALVRRDYAIQKVADSQVTTTTINTTNPNVSGLTAGHAYLVCIYGILSYTYNNVYEGWGVRDTNSGQTLVQVPNITTNNDVDGNFAMTQPMIVVATSPSITGFVTQGSIFKCMTVVDLGVSS